jgi:hypothetical protein
MCVLDIGSGSGGVALLAAAQELARNAGALGIQVDEFLRSVKAA